MREFLAELGSPIFTGAQAGMEYRWSAVNFFDKVIFAQASINPVYWVGGPDARPVPGLDTTEFWDGVSALAGHLLLWHEDRIKYCAIDDFTTWIPVGQTASSARATLAASFTHPKKGQTTDWAYLKESDRVFTVDQFARIDLNPNDPENAVYNFYTVAAVADTSGLSSDAISVPVTLSGAANRIYTTTFIDWPVGSRLIVNGRTTQAVVTATGGKKAMILALSGGSQAVPMPGKTFTVNLTDNPTGLKAGDVLSLGDVGQDLYRVHRVGFSLVLERLNIGTNRKAEGFVIPGGAVLVTQPFIEIALTGPALTIRKDATITAEGAVKLTALGLTGESAPGSVIPAGNTLATLDANEAGEFINAGADINGPIFGIPELDEYGVILKEKSIQTLQYTGFGNGVFFARTELVDVGPIARNAWVRVDTSSLIFVGESEVYQYFGGKNIQPVALQVTKEFFTDLDRDRKDEIILYHYKTLDQVWMAYPSLSKAGTRVLIFNYRENSAVIDDYGSAIGALTAIGAVHWELAPTWNDLSNTQTWSGETKRWREYVEEGLQRYTVLACSGDQEITKPGGEVAPPIPRLLMHGRVFSRAATSNCAPEAYLALAETGDRDLGDPERIKYADTLHLNVEIRPQIGTTLNHPLNLYVQFGCRDNLDSDLRWTAPARVEVSGNGMKITKVNIRGSGRFIRIRFFSQQIGIQWRIAGWELITRLGGTL